MKQETALHMPSLRNWRNEMLGIGQRKLVATLSYACLSLLLGFLGLLLDKITGGEFVSTVQATGAVVATFITLNIAGKVFGKDGSS